MGVFTVVFQGNYLYDGGTTPSDGRYEGAVVRRLMWVARPHGFRPGVPKPLHRLGQFSMSTGCGSLFQCLFKSPGISFNQQMPKVGRVLDPLQFGPDQTSDVVPDLLKVLKEDVLGDFTDNW